MALPKACCAIFLNPEHPHSPRPCPAFMIYAKQWAPRRTALASQRHRLLAQTGQVFGWVGSLIHAMVRALPGDSSGPGGWPESVCESV